MCLTVTSVKGNILIKEGSAIITGFAFTNKTLYDNRTLSGSTAQALLPYARWMAIELLNSASEHKRLDFTSESDIWSLGMTFYVSLLFFGCKIVNYNVLVFSGTNCQETALFPH